MREKAENMIIKIAGVLLILLSTHTLSPAYGQTIHYLHVDGIVNPVMAEFIMKGIENAAKENAETVVIQLDTPGGLDLSMRDIVKAILSSDVPIVVYVAPSGSRAASAGSRGSSIARGRWRSWCFPRAARNMTGWSPKSRCSTGG